MTVLFRWLFLSTLMRILAITIAVVSVFMIAESFDKARAIGDGMTINLLIEYLLLKIPYMISEFMPVVVLIAAGVYVTEISKNHELVALRAAGVSIYLVILPLLSAGAIAGFFTFAMGEWVEPVTNERLAYIERVKIQKKQPIQQGVQWLKDEGLLMRLTPLTDGYFSMLLLKTDKEGGWIERIDADKAIYKDGIWELDNTFTSKPNANKVVEIMKKKHVSIASKMGPETVSAPAPRDMKWADLYRFQKKLADAGLESAAYQFQLHRKLAGPLGCLIMIILAYSLCNSMGDRMGKSKGLLIAVVTGLLFYIFSSAISVFVTSQQLPVVYAAWLPNILFTGLAGFLLLKNEGY